LKNYGINVTPDKNRSHKVKTSRNIVSVTSTSELYDGVIEATLKQLYYTNTNHTTNPHTNPVPNP